MKSLFGFFSFSRLFSHSVWDLFLPGILAWGEAPSTTRGDALKCLILIIFASHLLIIC